MRRLYPDHPIVGVGALIIREGKLLLEKRRSNPGKGKWSIPGGIVELGETLEQTVIREVKEETNLDVERPEHIDIVDNIEFDENDTIKYHFVIIDYFVKLKGGTLRAGSDAADLQWVALDKVKELDLTRTFREFITRNYEKLSRLDSSL